VDLGDPRINESSGQLTSQTTDLRETAVHGKTLWIGYCISFLDFMLIVLMGSGSANWIVV